MKSDVMPSVVQMEPEVLKRLVTEVKETVAMDVQAPKTTKNTLKEVDLWKIQRGIKSAHGMRKRVRITSIGYSVIL